MHGVVTITDGPLGEAAIAAMVDWAITQADANGHARKAGTQDASGNKVERAGSVARKAKRRAAASRAANYVSNDQGAD